MKSKIITRFELFCYGEAQRIGFLQGLEETTIPEDLQSALVYKFDKELKMPPRDIFKTKLEEGQYIASYFTTDGLKKFKKEIVDVIEAINEDNVLTVGKIVTNKDDDLVLYEDEYQVIQISKDLSDISTAIVSGEHDEGQYSIIEEQRFSNNILINEVSLNELGSYESVKPDIIVYPFYLQGELVYTVDAQKNIVTITNERIY